MLSSRQSQFLFLENHSLVGGIPTPLKNMKVNGKDDNPYNYEMENNPAMFKKPPTRYIIH